MRIAVRGGHNSQAIGSRGIIDEYTEDRKVTSSLVKYLRNLGYEVKDVSPGPMNSSNDLVYGVNEAVKFNADLFISVHFNNAYTSYNGAIGSETLIHSQNKNSIDATISKRILKKLEEAGFKNRGIKHNDALYEMRVNKTKNIPAIIIEVCFVEATKDVELYQKLGFDYIGKIIAEGITDKNISSTNSSSNNTTSSNLYRVRKSWSDSASQKGAYSVLKNAINECKKYADYKVFDNNGIQVYPEIQAIDNEQIISTYKENGKATVVVNSLNVRDNPHSKKSNIVASYSKNESFYYNEVYISNAYVWVSYISNSGYKRYVVVKNKTTGERYANCV